MYQATRCFCDPRPAMLVSCLEQLFWIKLTWRTECFQDPPQVAFRANIMVILYVACWLDGLCGVESLHASLVAHQAGTYLLFQQHEATRSMFSPPLDGMLVHHRVIPSINFAGTCLYTWMEEGTERVNVSALPKNTTQCPWPGLKPAPLDQDKDASPLTMSQA